MRLLLVRHGDPDYEKDCLTGLGHRQAEVVARRLLSENIDEIFSSPLGRARETAQHFAELSGMKEIRILDFMREIRFGKEDALYRSGNPWLCTLNMVSKGIDLQSPDWRNYPDFADNTATVDVDRVMAASDGWLSTLGYQREGLYYRNINERVCARSVVLFSHGGSSTALLSRVLNIPFPHLCVLFGNLRHTAITVLRFDGTPGTLCMPVMEVGSDAGHLSEVGSEHDLGKIR